MAKNYVFRRKWDPVLRNKKRRGFRAPSIGLAAAQILGAATQAATASAPADFSASQTLGSITQVATLLSGGIAMSAAQTLGAATQSATMAVSVGVTAAQTLGAATQSATVAELVQVTANQTLGAATQSAAMTVKVSFSASQTLGGATQSATVAELVTLNASQLLGAVTQSAHLVVLGGFVANQFLDPIIQVGFTLTFGGSSGAPKLERSERPQDPRARPGLEKGKRKPERVIDQPKPGIPLPPPELIRRPAVVSYSPYRSPVELVDPRLIPSNLLDLRRQIQQAQDESDIAELERFLDGIES